MTPHPGDTPLEQWTQGWLVLEVASLLDRPEYILLYDAERKAKGWPVTQDEMRAFIRERRNETKDDAAGT